MKTRWLVILALLLALAPWLRGAKPAGSSPVQLEARRILANARTTWYSHRTEVDEVAGRYGLDCSGFATLILRTVAPVQLRAVRHAEHTARPRAFEFYATFATAATNRTAVTNGWLRVRRLTDAQPGDLVAWRKVKVVPGESTGHVVIVDGAPVREPGGLIRVEIIDATSAPHAADTRAAGASGVGRGTIWFGVDSQGQPVAVHGRQPTGKARPAMPIAIGRVVER